MCGGTNHRRKGGTILPVVSMNLPFEPTPKGRPRFTVKYNKVLTHTPPKTKAFESQIAFYYASEGGYIFEKGTPIEVTIIFGMPIPKSSTKKQKEYMLYGIKQHTVKPDLDNLTKAVLDGLNGVAWNDDSQIVELHVYKQYVNEPHIEITIQQTN